MPNDVTRQRDNDPVPEKVAQLAEYLRHHPDDLIDTRQLMQRFAVSAEEFLTAVELAEEVIQRPTLKESEGG